MLNLAEAIVEMRGTTSCRRSSDAPSRGTNPVDIINDCRDGMVIIGDRFAAGDYFLAELILPARSSRTPALCSPRTQRPKLAGSQPRGLVVMATPKGDIHDIGKNIVVMMLQSLRLRGP